MQDEDVDAIRRVYDEWSRGNWRPRFEIYDDAMEWGWSDEFPGLSGVYYDPAERNERVQEWLHGWEDWRCEAEELVVHGDQVVALCRYSGPRQGKRRERRHQGRPRVDAARRQGHPAGDLRD